MCAFILRLNQNSLEDRVSRLEQLGVRKTENQTIDGVKTFSAIPILPATNPVSDNEAARKAYVDTKTGHHSCTIFKASNQNVTAASGLDILTFTSGGVNQVGTLISKFGNSSIRCDAGTGLIRIRVHLVVDTHAADNIAYIYIRNANNSVLFCEITSISVASEALTISAVSPVIDIHSGLSLNERTFHAAIGKSGAGTLVARPNQTGEFYGTFMEIERLTQ